jgi:hypothetical protein
MYEGFAALLRLLTMLLWGLKIGLHSMILDPHIAECESYLQQLQDNPASFESRHSFDHKAIKSELDKLSEEIEYRLHAQCDGGLDVPDWQLEPGSKGYREVCAKMKRLNSCLTEVTHRIR